MNLLQAIGELILAWFQCDRIRVSPTTGRLLGLCPRNRFAIGNEIYTVIHREHTEHESIRYLLEGSQGQCQLFVTCSVNQPITATLTDNARQRFVFDDDLTLLEDQRRTPLIASDDGSVAV